MDEALELVTIVDEYLGAGYYLRDINGQLIEDLYTAVEAILQDRLLTLPCQCLAYRSANGGVGDQQAAYQAAPLLAEAAVW